MNTSSTTDFPQEISNEIFSRIEAFFGENKFAKLKASSVVIVGLGGVGSHAANMLVRSGVGRTRLIDFDNVSLSSLNRHATACLIDVGTPKAEALRNFLIKVVPWADIESKVEMFKGPDASRLLLIDSKPPDIVLDCIDDVNTKAELIAYCINHNIKVITSMGAGGKSDPTKLRIGMLSDCVNDPLASKIKWKLKKLGVNGEGVTTIYSCEKPICNLLPLDDDQVSSPKDFGVASYLRLRIIPVLGTSPSIFGQSMASYVICYLADDVYEPDSCERMSKNLRSKMKKSLIKNEAKRMSQNEEIELDDFELDFIVHTIWHSRCAVTGKRFGGHDPLTLLRWDESLPVSIHNVILVAQSVETLIQKNGREQLSEFLSISKRLEWSKRLVDENRYLRDKEYMSTDGLKKQKTKKGVYQKGLSYLINNIGNSSGFILFGVSCVILGYILGSKKSK